MRKKVISFSLSESSIDEAIKEIEVYQKDIEAKTEEIRIRVADLIKQYSQSGFDAVTFLDVALVKVGDGYDTVTITPERTRVDVDHSGNVSIVFTSADSRDAVWIEFGTGVTNNGAVGTSPHPQGQRLGFTIGSYGKGKGKQKMWGYKEGDNLYLTSGTKARMPMAKATASVINDLIDIAREVFGE